MDQEEDDRDHNDVGDQNDGVDQNDEGDQQVPVNQDGDIDDGGDELPQEDDPEFPEEDEPPQVAEAPQERPRRFGDEWDGLMVKFVSVTARHNGSIQFSQACWDYMCKNASRLAQMVEADLEHRAPTFQTCMRRAEENLPMPVLTVKYRDKITDEIHVRRNLEAMPRFISNQTRVILLHQAWSNTLAEVLDFRSQLHQNQELETVELILSIDAIPINKSSGLSQTVFSAFFPGCKYG